MAPKPSKPVDEPASPRFKTKRSAEKEPDYIANLRVLTRKDPDVTHLEALEQELYGDSDRATAVVLGSIVETSLERLLKTSIRNDLNSQDKRQIFDFEGALGTFSSRTIMAYAMKLIGPKARADLDLIRLLRNEFAHSRIPFNFETPEVKAVCDHLQYPDMPGAYIPHGFLSRVPHDKLEAASDMKRPRTRYIATCHMLAYRMLVKRDGPKAGDTVFPDNEPLP
jgi:hypothetical protein